MGLGSLQLTEIGPYTLLDQVAVGGMAEIYLAKTSGVAGFEKFLCLKVIHPNYADDDHFIEMLIDEAKICVGLNHANIVQIFDLGRDDRTYFIAMEFIDGEDLFKIMRSLSEREFDVPIDVAAYIAHEVCTGLDYAHRKRDDGGKPLGIIHRDISPQNVLISRSGEVKIVDFGIAKASSRSRKTQAGVIKGKYYYMSPEQAWGDPIDQRTDIFSAGIILYEILTGQMLYLEEDMHRLLDMVRKADISRPSLRRPDIPPQLENIVMKALAKRPADRWQTAHEFQVALTNFLFSFAPDFTPSRVAALLDSSETKAPAGSYPPSPPPEVEQKEPTQQVEVEDLMSRVDFRPQTEHSVIFRVGDLLDSTRDMDLLEDEDGGEKTQISGPPSMFPSTLPETALGTDANEWAEDEPTVVSANPPLRTHDAEVTLQEVEAAPAPMEVVVPQPVLKPRPSPPGLTPTPRVDRRHIEPPRPAAAPAPAPPSPPPPTLQPPGPPAEVSPHNGPTMNWQSLEAPRPASPVGPPPQNTMDWAGPAERPPPPRQMSPAAEQASTPPMLPRGAPPVPPQAMAQGTPPAPGQRPAPGWPAQQPGFGVAAPAAPAPAGPGAQQPAPPHQQVNAGAPVTLPVQPAGMQAGLAAPLSFPPQAPRQPMQPAQAMPAQPQQAWPQPPAQQPVPGGAWPAAQQPAPGGWPAQPQGYPPQPFPPGAPTQSMDPLMGPLNVDSGELRRAQRASKHRRKQLVLAAVLSLFGLAITAGVIMVLVPFGEEGGTIEVISVPEGARIIFDGKELAQTTPVVIPVKDVNRDYTVMVALATYQQWKRTLNLKEDRKVRVLAVLTPIHGRLDVRSVPRGADIYINGTFRGKTPTTIENILPTEDVNLELRRRGYKPVTKVIRWEGQSTYQRVDITLQNSR